MKDVIVTLKTAKLAKEKGFDYSLEYYFFPVEDDREYIIRHKSTYFKPYTLEEVYKQELFKLTYPAPTQSLLQKWIRERHNIHIDIFIQDEAPYTNFYYRIMEIGQYFVISYYNDISATYEEALEKGLQHALKQIK